MLVAGGDGGDPTPTGRSTGVELGTHILSGHERENALMANLCVFCFIISAFDLYRSWQGEFVCMYMILLAGYRNYQGTELTGAYPTKWSSVKGARDG